MEVCPWVSIDQSVDNVVKKMNLNLNLDTALANIDAQWKLKAN